MDITKLPEDCIAGIISYTSPIDACRSSLVHSAFRAAADSDAVWERFLPSNYREIIFQSSSSELNSLPKKKLFFHLCDHPVLVAENTMAFSLEKITGKKRFMVGAKGLDIIWGDDPRYWKWSSMSVSRFPLVAELDHVWWLKVSARIETKRLSPNTTYGVYFIFKFGRRKRGFRNRHMDLRLIFERTKNVSQKIAILDSSRNGPQQRNDGWKEVEMGEFFNEHGDDGPVDAELFAFDATDPLGGLIIEGIEFRPKSTA